MKNKKTWVGIIILLLIVLIVSINFHKIRFALSMLDIYTKNTKESTISEDNQDETDPVVDNPLDSIVGAEPSVESTENNVDKANVHKAETDDIAQVEVNPVDKSEEKKQASTKSVKTIATKYNQELTEIQNNFQGELNSLVQEGYNEYKSGKLSTTQLANKYISQGASLEKKCDQLVYSHLEDIKKELKENGHDTSLVNEIKSYYENFKEKEKNKLFEKAYNKLD